MRLNEENRKSRVLKALQKAMEKDLNVSIDQFKYLVEDLDEYKNDHLIKTAERLGRGFALDVILFRCMIEAVEEADRFSTKKIFDLAMENAKRESRLLNSEEANALTWGVKNLYRDFVEK